MRLHSSTLTAQDLCRALPEGVYANITPRGSRKRARAFEVTLYVLYKDDTHRRFGNSGGYGRAEDVAATWDEWGIWMAALYALDSDALVGWYDSHTHFLKVTQAERERIQATHKPESLAYRTHLAPWLD